MILFCFVIAWALVGAFEQAGRDARTGVRGVRTSVRDSASRRFHAARTHPARSVRWPARAAYGTYKTGAGVWYGGRASVRGVRRAGSSLRTGWRAGAVRGRERHAAYVAKREQWRRANAVPPHGAPAFPDPPDGPDRPAPVVKPRARTGEPVPKNWTVRMQWPDGIQQEPFDARHPSAIAVWDEQDLARRRADLDEMVERGDLAGYEVIENEPDESAWESGAMHSSPESPEDAPASTPEGEHDMTMTGEAATYEATQATYKEIVAKAQEFVDVVDQMQASLQSANLDAETLGDTADILDAAQSVQAAAEKALGGFESRHAQLHEAISTASVEPADTAYYRG